LKKRPKSKFIPKDEKKPRQSPQHNPGSIINVKPSWRFGMLDLKGPWGWEKIDKKDVLTEIIEKLKNFETMTWGEIERTNKSHLIPCNNIVRQAKDRLIELELDDLDGIYSIRLKSRERIWGKREIEAFYVIWWDPEHTVYPVSPKNT
jgi:hypothetical protein